MTKAEKAILEVMSRLGKEACRAVNRIHRLREEMKTAEVVRDACYKKLQDLAKLRRTMEAEKT